MFWDGDIRMCIVEKEFCNEEEGQGQELVISGQRYGDKIYLLRIGVDFFQVGWVVDILEFLRGYCVGYVQIKWEKKVF